MLDTFYLDRLLDQTCEQQITMIISVARKAILPIFVSICFLVNCSCWLSKSFLPFSVLREWQKMALSRMTALPLLPLQPYKQLRSLSLCLCNYIYNTQPYKQLSSLSLCLCNYIYNTQPYKQLTAGVTLAWWRLHVIGKGCVSIGGRGKGR